MTSTASARDQITRNSYLAAALGACVVFCIVELAAPLLSGPGQAELNTLLGRLAFALAGLTTPDDSILRAGSNRQALASQLFLAAEVVLSVAFIGLLWWRIRPGSGWTTARHRILLGVQICITLALGSLAFSANAAPKPAAHGYALEISLPLNGVQP